MPSDGSNCEITQITRPSPATPASSGGSGTRRWGIAQASNPAASGIQRRIWIMAGPSSALDQEVEGKAGEPGNQKQRIGAQIARLGAADRGVGALGDLGRPVDQPLDHVALEGRVGPLPYGQRGSNDQDVDQLVEVPLALEEGVEGGQPPLQGRGGARRPEVHVGGGGDPEDRKRPADRQASPGGRRARALLVEARVLEGAAEEGVDDVVDSGDLNEAGEEGAGP